MKRVLALILALACILSVTACGAEGKAKRAAEGFLTAFCELDFDRAAEFVDSPEDMPEALKNLDLDEMLEDIPEEYREKYGDEIEAVISKLIARVKANCSYVINGIIEKDDAYEVDVTMTVPDVEDVDFSSILSESNLLKLLGEKLGDGTISLSSSEEEIVDALLPDVIKMLDNAIESITIGSEEMDVDLVVVEIDGKWLVSLGESDID